MSAQPPPPGADSLTGTTSRSGIAEAFTFTWKVQARYSDFDSQLHLNNASYITYLEAARVAFLQDVLGQRIVNGWVVAEVRCRYLAPVPFGTAEVLVHLRVLRAGRSSIAFGFAMTLRDGPRVAEGDVAQVHVDARTGRPAPLAPEWRARIETHQAQAGAAPPAADAPPV